MHASFLLLLLQVAAGPYGFGEQGASVTAPVPPAQPPLEIEVIEPTPALVKENILSTILLLGEESVPIGAAKVVITGEAVGVNSIEIQLTQESDSIRSMMVYSAERLLGEAFRRSGGKYVLLLGREEFRVPRKETTHFYVTANLLSEDEGGVSGEAVQISSITVKGYGEWSSNQYSEPTTGTHRAFETARARYIGVTHSGGDTEFLREGNTIEIARFSLQGATLDPLAEASIDDVVFQVNTRGTLSVSNVRIGTVSGPESSCSIVGSEITCSSMPLELTAVSDNTKEIVLYATVSVPSQSDSVSLQVSIGDLGDSTTAGDITWTDGDATFQWVGTPYRSVQGTYYFR